MLSLFLRVKIMSTTLNVMGPLVVGDPFDPGSARNEQAWEDFRREIEIVRDAGAECITTDLWWAVIEPEDGKFDWSYADRLASTIIGAGLKWIPILSFHSCGGNTGDDVLVPFPRWVYMKLARSIKYGIPRDVMFVSEQGNACTEYISFWCTDAAMPLYRRFIQRFKRHFSHLSEHIPEIDIGLGPAGEARYPSYNKHDRGTDCPDVGALQCYSTVAQTDFRRYVFEKYGDIGEIDRNWFTAIAEGAKLAPPDDAPQFRQRADHCSVYGLDLFDWYAASLRDHVRKVVTCAIDVLLSENSAFKGVDIGIKVPGVHWRTGFVNGHVIEFGDRMAELNAGLFARDKQSAYLDLSKAIGYRPLMKEVKALSDLANGQLVLHFTCLEMPDGKGGRLYNSLAHSLVKWLAEVAHEEGVRIKGENALAGSLYDYEAWECLKSHLFADFPYQGLTLLRLKTIAETPTILKRLEDLRHGKAKLSFF